MLGLTSSSVGCILSALKSQENTRYEPYCKNMASYLFNISCQRSHLGLAHHSLYAAHASLLVTPHKIRSLWTLRPFRNDG